MRPTRGLHAVLAPSLLLSLAGVSRSRSSLPTPPTFGALQDVSLPPAGGSLCPGDRGGVA